MNPNTSSSKDSAILELRGIYHTFPDGNRTVEALRGIDLTVLTGEMVAIMGPSGSGKSTLLKIAGGILSPTEGQVLFAGRALNEFSNRELAVHRRRHVGYVFQEYNLVDNLTAEENVALPLELDGVAVSRSREAARNALKLTGVEEITNRWAADLSGGQQQRVAVARALVARGRVLLADEPTGALDSVASDEVMKLLRERVDAGATCLLVTHEPRLAAWADRILYLRDGRFASADEVR
ncbi:MAG: ABC transporter ATP-binding protein [Actinomycetaceae bacterium]|nr:ABC transporter ATP-binding protein [Actinomycetaceae bacterium]